MDVKVRGAPCSGVQLKGHFVISELVPQGTGHNHKAGGTARAQPLPGMNKVFCVPSPATCEKAIPSSPKTQSHIVTLLWE